MERISRYARIQHEVVPSEVFPSVIDLALAVYAATKLQIEDAFDLGRTISAVGLGKPSYDVVGARVQALGLGRPIGDGVVLQLKQDQARVATSEPVQLTMSLLTWFVGAGAGAEAVERSFLAAGVPAAIATILGQAPPDDCTTDTLSFWQMIGALVMWTLRESDVQTLVNHGYVELLAKAITFRTNRDFTRADEPRDGRASTQTLALLTRPALINSRAFGIVRLIDCVKLFPSLRADLIDRVRPLLSTVLHYIDVKLVASDGPTAWEREARGATRMAWEAFAKTLKLDVPPAPAQLICAYRHCTTTDAKLSLCSGCVDGSVRRG